MLVVIQNVSDDRVKSYLSGVQNIGVSDLRLLC